VNDRLRSLDQRLLDRSWDHAGATCQDAPAVGCGGSTLTSRGSGTPNPNDERGSPGTPPLEPEEELVAVLRGIGSVMFLTSARIIVARDGMERRPRSGIQSFPVDTIRLIRVERGSGPSGRVVIWGPTGQEVVSMFFESRSLDRAEELVAAARILVARQRRGSAREAPRDPRAGRTD
jgi:hypothetical protein